MLKFLCFLSFFILISLSKSVRNDCGLADQTSGLIIGGANTSQGKWPWLVALVRKSDEKFFCGATLISSKHILTGDNGSKVLISDLNIPLIFDSRALHPAKIY